MKLTYQNGCMTISEATQNDIDNMTWPSDMIDLHIRGDYVDHIVIPDGVTSFVCTKGLITCIVPDSMEYLYVNGNRLSELDLPRDIIVVDASNNYLKKITFRGGSPTRLCQLILETNRLKDLDFDLAVDQIGVFNVRFNDGLQLSPRLMEFVRNPGEECEVIL